MTVPWNKDAYQYSYELECRVGRLLDENKELKAKLKAAEAALAASDAKLAEAVTQAAVAALRPAWFPTDYNYKQACGAVQKAIEATLSFIQEKK